MHVEADEKKNNLFFTVRVRKSFVAKGIDFIPWSSFLFVSWKLKEEKKKQKNNFPFIFVGYSRVFITLRRP